MCFTFHRNLGAIQLSQPLKEFLIGVRRKLASEVLYVYFRKAIRLEKSSDRFQTRENGIRTLKRVLSKEHFENRALFVLVLAEVGVSHGDLVEICEQRGQKVALILHRIEKIWNLFGEFFLF